jgi:lipoyl(octanoyl) transferase
MGVDMQDQPLPPVEWRVSDAPVPYPDALADLNDRAEALAAGQGAERIWLLEHPPLYTAGTSANPAELLDQRFPVYEAGRGGKYTYHGPGQRIGYLSLNLAARGKDVRSFVHEVEGWVIRALARLGVEAWRAEGRVGIWTVAHGQEAKIGAIGIRVRKWVTMHGFSVNVSPDLAHFGGIVPCGLPEFAVTSLADLGVTADMAALDAALVAENVTFLQNITRAQKNA